MCREFAVQQGIPLNDLTLSKMSQEEQRFWEDFLKEAKEVIDREDAKRAVDKKTQKMSNVILTPPPSLKSKYQTAITEYDGKKYCQIRQLEEIFTFKERMLKKEKEEKEEKEKCVLCGKETEYLRSTPINKRKYYVEGCGQVCGHCANEMGIE